MKRLNQLLFVVLIAILVLLFYKDNKAPETQVKNEPATLAPIPGTELKSVELTQKAAERLGIETEEVRWAPISRSGANGKVVPYSSLIYGLNGETWVYINPEPFVFVRHSISVDFIDGDNVYLSDGPPLETLVVTVGVAELYGTETGVGK